MNETIVDVKTANLVAERIRRAGLAVVPGYVDRQTLATLNDEFDRFQQVTHRAVTLHDQKGGRTFRVLRDRLDRESFPATLSVFSSGFMNDVARQYLGTTEYRLNYEIFVSYHVPSPQRLAVLPYLLHADKCQTLKFFLYLIDTSRRNGAMEVIPGSHVENAARRAAAMRERRTRLEFRHVISSKVEAAIPVEGEAGTLIVFDTDTCHRAGHVSEGCERRVMRGHTESGQATSWYEGEGMKFKLLRQRIHNRLATTLGFTSPYDDTYDV